MKIATVDLLAFIAMFFKGMTDLRWRKKSQNYIIEMLQYSLPLASSISLINNIRAGAWGQR